MSTPRLLVTEEDVGDDSNSKTDSSKNLEGTENDAPKNLKPDGGENEGRVGDEEDRRCLYETSVSSTEGPPLAQPEPGEDDEGFRTPTSLDHRIPEITECPPAPKKTRTNLSTKRKEISPRVHLSLHHDFSSTEVESIFRPELEEDVANDDIKKARREDSE